MKSSPTIIDVANLAGVSKSTVSRVLSGPLAGVSPEKKTRVLRAVAELGYVRNEIARNLRSDTSRLVMLVVPDLSNPTWAETARGAQDALEEHDYHVVIGSSGWSDFRESGLLFKARQNRLAGLLINPVRVDNDDLLAVGIPTVIVGIAGGYPLFDAVASGTYASAEESLAYLASLGHTRIGLIMGIRHRKSAPTRLSAYIDYHRERGIPQDDSLIVTSPFTIAGGKEALGRLASLDSPPTAIFCDNDILAIGALLAAREIGIRVPDDLSIVGVDDMFAAAITSPPLTTIAIPRYEIGRQAARLLVENIESTAPVPPRKVLLRCTLRIRGTTAEARRS